MFRRKPIKLLVSLLSFLLIFSQGFSNITFAAGKAYKTTTFAGKKEQKGIGLKKVQQKTATDQTKLRKSQSPNNLSSQNGKQPTLNHKIKRPFKPNTPSYVPDELIIKFKNSAAAVNARSKHSLKTKKKLKSVGAEVVKIQKSESVSQLVKTLKADPSVAFVQPNYIYKPADLPNDPDFSQLWGLHNTGQTINDSPGVAGMDIEYPEAMQEFNKLPDNGPVVVAVIDTGVDINHPDLKNNIWTNPGEIPGNGLDDDGNGYIDDVNGWDFYHSDNTVFDPEDGDEHGTHVSGTIAASANNGIGVAGIAPNVKIMPLKFIGPYGGSTADAITAIEYAKSMGVKISNNSWGGPDYDQALKDAIDNANMLFMVAAGNDSTNTDVKPAYPSSFNSQNIISVAAIDNTGNLANFSNYGTQSVDIAAPGVNILSTIPKHSQVGVAAQISNSTYHYKAIFNGFGFEHFSDTDRQAAFKKATDYLGLTASSKILLVQDDESDSGYTNFLDTYKSLLTNAGFTFDVKTISTDANGPDLSVLNNYDSVIWFTGWAMGNNNPPLTAADISSLDQFLKNGNKSLILSGEDALYRNEDSSFVKDTLSLTIQYEGETRPAEGVAGTIYEGDMYQLSSAPYTDYIDTNNTDIAIINLILPAEENYNNAYAFFDGTSMATPHVTGVAALLENKYPNASISEIKNMILASGDSLPVLNGKVLSGKKLNAYNALTYNPDNQENMDNEIPGTPLNTDSANGTLDAATDKDDVYSVQLSAGETIKATISGDVGTDFDLYLYGSNATSVSSNTNMLAYSENEGSSDETIGYTATEPGTYYIDVSAYSGNGAYQLKVSIGNGAGNSDANDDQLPGVEINDSTVTGDLNDNSDYLDIWAINLEAGKTYSFSFNGDQGTNFNYSLFAPGTTDINSNEPIRTLTDASSEEYMTYPVEKTGTYYLVAYAYYGSGKYNIKIGSKPTVKDDDISEAVLLKTSEVNDFLDPKDLDDVYSVDLKEGQIITLNLSSSATNQNDFDLYLYGPDATTVDYTVTNYVPEVAYSNEWYTSSENITFTANQTGKYYIDVFDGLGSGPYKLKSSVPGPLIPVVSEVTDHATEVTGTTVAGANVTITIENSQYSTKSDTTGFFKVEIPTQPAGTIITITAMDDLGNLIGGTSVTVADKTAPEAPQVKEVTDQSTDVSGTAEVGTTITVKIGSAQYRTTTDTNKNFKVTIPVQIAGSVIKVTASDAANNVSPETMVTVKDGTAPLAPLVNDITDLDNVITGKAEPGSKITATIGSEKYFNNAGTDGSFSIAIPLQTVGTVLSFTATDAAGNISPETSIIVKDSAIPAAPFVNILSDQSEVVTGKTIPGGKVTVTIDSVHYLGDADADGSFSIPIPLQKSGTIISVTVEGDAGKVSSATIVTVIDKTAPEAPFVNDVTDQSKTVTGKAEPGSKVSATIGAVPYFDNAGADGSFSIAIPLQKSGTVLSVTAEDTEHNVSPVTSVIVKDVTAPGAPSVNTVSDQSMTVTGKAEPGSKVTVTIGSVPYFDNAGADGSFSIAIPLQKAGTVLSVTAEDTEHNLSLVTSVIVKDVTAPSAPSVNTVSDQSKEITGKAEADTDITVIIGSNKFYDKADSKGYFNVAIPQQKAGTKLSITAKDAAGNISVAKAVTVIDKTAPSVPTVNTVSDLMKVVSGKAEANATITVTIGSKKYYNKTDSKGYFSVAIPQQKAGTKLSVTATDAAGNISVTKAVTVVDKTAPSIPTVNTVSDLIKVVSGKAEAGATITVIIGTKNYYNKVDSKGYFTVIIPLQKAGIKLSITAKDAAGNVSMAKSITVADKTAPSVPTVYTVSDQVKVVTGKAEAGATVTVTIGSKKYYYKADSKGYFKVTIPKQSAGTKFYVTATDAAGNRSTARTVTIVDKTAPSAPKVNTVKSSTTIVTGTTEAYAAITIKLGKTIIGSARADKYGKFKVKIKAQKKNKILSVTSTDAAKNISKQTSVKVK